MATKIIVVPKRRRRGSDKLSKVILSLYPDDLIAYHKLNEPSGATSAIDYSSEANDAAYSASGVTLGVTGVGDGNTAARFDGNNSHVLLGDAAFAAAWDGDKGSAIAFAKVDSASRWTDSATYRYPYHIRSSVNSLYYIVFGKTSNDNQLTWRRRTGGGITEILHTHSGTGWFMQGLTWDLAADEVKAYFNGALVSTGGNSLATWPTSGQEPDGGETVLFAGSTSAQEWIGDGAHVATWADRVLTDSDMQAIYEAVVPPTPVTYFIRDEFTDTVAAGSVDGRSATPGVAGEKWSIFDDADDTISIENGAFTWDQWSTSQPWARLDDSGGSALAIPRVVGRTLHFRVRQFVSGNYHYAITLSSGTTEPTVGNAELQFRTIGPGSPVYFVTGGTQRATSQNHPASGVFGEFKIVLKAAGATLYYKNVDVWEEVADESEGTAATLYLSWSNHTSVASDGEIDFIRIYDE